jgi:hypothetical protein
MIKKGMWGGLELIGIYGVETRTAEVAVWSGEVRAPYY